MLKKSRNDGVFARIRVRGERHEGKYQTFFRPNDQEFALHGAFAFG